MEHRERILAELAKIAKNSTTEIRIHVSEYRERRYLVFREFFQGSDGEYRAGKTGINIGEQHFEAVLGAVKLGLESFAEGRSDSPSTPMKAVR